MTPSAPLFCYGCVMVDLHRKNPPRTAAAAGDGAVADCTADGITVATRRGANTDQSAAPAHAQRPVSPPSAPGASARDGAAGGGADGPKGVKAEPDFHAGGLLDGRYRLVKQIGEGGMGSVYLVDDVLLRQRSALKTLHFDPLSAEEDLERFRREVAITHNIHHPNVARTYDIGEANGVHYLSMEWLDGESLMDRLRRGELLSAAEVRQLALPLCFGLRAAHRAGIVHRDLKPANLMLVKDARKVVIVDFGIATRILTPRVAPQATEAPPTVGADSDWAGEARSPAGAALAAPMATSAATSAGDETVNTAWQVTSAGRGTPAYMAPEQWNEASGDARTDVYGLGVILYVALTGKPPFRALTTHELRQKHEFEAPPDVRTENAEVDAGLATLIQWCMAKDPDDRPKRMDVVIATLLAGQRRRAWLTSVAIAAVAAAAVTMTLHVGAFTVAKRAFISEMQPALSRLARLAARDVPVADLAQIARPEDRNTAAFARVHEVLQRYRRESAEIKSVYVMRVTPKPGRYALIADDHPDDHDDNHDGVISAGERGITIGERYDGRAFPAMARTLATGVAQADDVFAVDAWGVSLSGYAPIAQPGGEKPALFLGVDAGNAQLSALKRQLDTLLVLLAVLFVLGWSALTWPLATGGTLWRRLPRLRRRRHAPDAFPPDAFPPDAGPGDDIS